MLGLVFAMMLTATGQYVPDSREFLSETSLRRVGLQRYWEARLPFSPSDKVAHATLRDRMLYVVTDNGDVAAMHAGTGVSLWARNLNDRGYAVIPPTHIRLDDGRKAAVFVSARNVQIVEVVSGSMLAEFAIDFPAGSPAVGDADVLYLGSSDGHVYSLDWRAVIDFDKPVFLWRVMANGPVRSAMEFDGVNLFFASESGGVHSCVGANRVERWSAYTSGPITAGLILHETAVYASSVDRSVYRYDELSGRRDWQVRLPVALRRDPVIAGRLLYQPTESAGVFAIDIDKGEVRWSRPDAGQFLARDGDNVWLLRADGNELVAVDEATGQQRHATDAYDVSLAATNTADNGVYLVTKASHVVCLRPAEEPHLSYRELTRIHENLQSRQPAEVDAANDSLGTDDEDDEEEDDG